MNSSRQYLEDEIRSFADALAPNSLVLDAGAGDCCYAPIFRNHGYESADFAQVNKSYGALDYVCDLCKMPIADGRFDAVVCTQVLAHIPRPADALSELERVLKPGGRLLLTAPLFFHENEQPYDFFRFTQFGLRKLMEGAGFVIVRLDWLEGYYGTLGYQMGVAARALRAKPSYFGGGPTGWVFAGLTLLIRPVCAALAIALSKADRIYKITRIGQCKNYLVIATKAHGRTTK